MRQKFALFFVFATLTTIFGQIPLRNTGLSVSRTSFAVRVPHDAWDNPAVICSTDVGCADVIFVVDTSGSMTDKIDALYTEIGRFASTLEAMGYDGAYGLVTYVDAARFPVGDTLFHDPARFASFIASLRGAEGSYEHTSEAVYLAIDSYYTPTPDTCEKIIICITDETEDDSDPPYTNANIISLASSVPGGVHIYLLAPSGHPMQPVCTATGGRWYDISSTSVADLMEDVADDIAEFSAITITVRNNTGAPISLLRAELNPLSCITLDTPSDTIQNRGPIAAGDSAIITWRINEVFGCAGCEDCFNITLNTGSFADTVFGCLFVENCGCPGLDALVIEPRRCDVFSACNTIVFKFEGCFPVNPNTVRINVNGTIISYPDARLVFNASEQTMSYTPSTPFTDGSTVSFYVQEAYDIQGCALNYAQHCQITVDRSAPILTIEHGFTPACGSHITVNDTIRFSGYVRDTGAGMALLNAISGLATAPFRVPVPMYPGLGLQQITLTNGIGWPPPCRADTTATGTSGIPFAGFTGYHINCTDLAPLGSCDCATFVTSDYYFSFAVRAGDITTYMLNPENITICFTFSDAVESANCGANTRDTCCTWYFTSCIPVSPNNLLLPANGTSATCSLNVTFQWTASTTGTAPIQYDLYLDGTAVATNLTTTTHSYGWIRNLTASPQTHTWFVIAHNACGVETTAVWNFTVQPCCTDIGAFNLISPTGTFSCSTLVDLQWTAPASGTAPITYNVYLDGTRIATGISLLHYLVGWMRNTGSTPQTHTWYIDAINPCDTLHSSTFTFTINPCCVDATATIGCPYPVCNSRTSCADAPISFIIVPAGTSTINHARTYLRIFVRHASGSTESFNIVGTHTTTLWHGDTLTVRWAPIANGDSVTIFLDSLFTIDGCKTSF